MKSALGRTSRNRLVRVPVDFYLWLFRGTPLLLQILFWYDGLSELTGNPKYLYPITRNALVAGTLAILVTLAAKGWVAAVILLGVLIIEDQLEGHLLQPQVVGRVIRLHPLAIILSLAVGSVLAGIAGAVVAVPIVAVITRAVPELRRRDPAPGGP